VRLLVAGCRSNSSRRLGACQNLTALLATGLRAVDEFDYSGGLDCMMHGSNELI